MNVSKEQFENAIKTAIGKDSEMQELFFRFFSKVDGGEKCQSKK